MKKYLLNITIYILGTLSLLLFLSFFADGNTDNNYLRFASPKQSNLILGNSRSAQGLQPSIFNSQFPTHTFFNYSFNIAISKYGDSYLKAIKAKLDTTQKGIFILTVDPWSISEIDHLNAQLPERESFLNKLHFYNLNPNFEYLLKFYHQSWFDLYFYNENKGKRSIYLHKNGWLEVNIKVDSTEYAKIENEKLRSYAAFQKDYSISPVRVAYLEKTIKYLQQYGSVFLVRLPQSDKFIQIENKYDQNFDRRMKKIAEAYKIPYYNLLHFSKNVHFTDGNHLNPESGKYISQIISDSIKKYQNP